MNANSFLQANTIVAAIILSGTGVFAGVDQVSYSGSWGTTAIDPLQPATAVAANQGLANNIFVSGSSGVQNYVLSGSTWTPTTVSSTAYTALSNDEDESNKFYGSSAGGTEAVTYVGGGIWNTSTVNSTHYGSMASTQGGGNEFIATAVGGGVDQVYFDGTNWQSIRISNQSYVSVATDFTDRYTFYLAKAGGGVDWMYYSGGWNVVPDVTPGNYVSLATDLTGIYRFYGARADGGVDHINYVGGGVWTVGSASSETYLNIASDTTTAYHLFGVNLVPEPTSLSTLAGFMICAARRHRR